MIYTTKVETSIGCVQRELSAGKFVSTISRSILCREYLIGFVAAALRNLCEAAQQHYDQKVSSGRLLACTIEVKIFLIEKWQKLADHLRIFSCHIRIFPRVGLMVK